MWGVAVPTAPTTLAAYLSRVFFSPIWASPNSAWFSLLPQERVLAAFFFAPYPVLKVDWPASFPADKVRGEGGGQREGGGGKVGGSRLHLWL